MDHVALVSLNMSDSAKKLLRNAGFVTLADVRGVKPMALARELRVAPAEALRLLKEIQRCAEEFPAAIESGPPRSFGKPASRTALDMLQEPCRSILTFCRPLDDALGGGVPVGEITELCGSPGSGKTQLGMQLAVDACIPAAFGGVEGEALYVDTEGSFAAERVKDLCRGMLKHLRNCASRNPDAMTRAQQLEAVERIGGVEGVLRRIHYCRVHTHSEQLALGRALAGFAEARPRLRLLVVDSVAFHFRHAFEDMAHRTRLLNGHAAALNAFAARSEVAVVVVNQVTTKFGSALGCNQGDDRGYLVPALGESWSHAITNRVMLTITPDFCSHQSSTRPVPVRQAHLVKSPSRAQRAVNFVVLEHGVRGVPRQRKRRREPEDGGLGGEKRVAQPQDSSVSDYKLATELSQATK